MKMMRYLLFVYLIILLCSCADEHELTTDSLIGKWKLTQTYNGYANGGTFTWDNTPDTYSRTIAFTSGGQYLESEIYLDYQHQNECSGTYRTLSATLVEIESSCQTVKNQFSIELTHTTLIIDHQVREGVIRKKYVLIEQESTKN